MLLAAACGIVSDARPVQAAQVEVWLVLSAPGGVYAATARKLQETWELDGRQQLSWRIGTWGELPQEPGALPQLVVTLGTGAYLEGVGRAQSNPALQRLPVLAALLPQVAFPAPAARGSWRAAAVLLDQPAERIVHLLQLALPGHSRVGVLFGPDSVAVRPVLARALATGGLTLVAQTVQDGGPGIYAALRTLLDEADLLLALPDKQVFQSSNMYNILQAAYRRRVPVASYSAAHVRAGALLALHTEPVDVARQLAEVLRLWLAGRGLPASALADAGSITINDQVARSLGLSLPPSLALERAIRQKEAAS